MMEEIDIREILYYILKKKFFVIIFTIIGLIAGFTYTKFLITPMYASNTTVVLSKPTTASGSYNTLLEEGITQGDLTLNSKLVATYSEIMKSRAVAEQVKQTLGLDVSEESLMSNISVSAKSDTEMLTIKVLNENPQIAADIANTLSVVFTEKVKEIYNIENVTVIDKAIPNSKPNNINYVKNSALFGAVGLVLSSGILFLIFYFDTRIKSKTEVEELLDLEVLAVIPEFKN